MVTLELKESVNLKTKQALFLKFDYNLDILERVRKLPNRHFIPKTQEWEIPTRHVDELVTALQEYEVTMLGKFPKDIRTKIENVARFAPLYVSSDAFSYKTTPYPYQREGFEYGMKHSKFLLGDDPGLGKSKQVIDLAVARRTQFKHCLIVCGVNGLKYNWLNEVKVHSNEKARIIGSRINKRGRLTEGTVAERLSDLCRADLSEFFLITNHETMRNPAIQQQLRSMTDRGLIGMVVIDEFHKCATNPTSQTGSAIHELRAYYKVALTGTPLVNDPRDFYNLLKWLDVEKHTWTQFQLNYCVTGEGFEVVGYKNMMDLRGLVERNMLRRRKKDVLKDLPEKLHKVEYVEMGPKQQKIYDEILTRTLQEIDKIALLPNPLSGLIRLRQATGYTGILSTQVAESAKLSRMVELVEDIVDNGEKVVIFSNWTQITQAARQYLKKYDVAYFTGEQTERENQDNLRKFKTNSNCHIIIGTMETLGTGFTLTEATTAIFLDSPWNPANKQQAEDRLHRIGTKTSPTIITLVTKGTIDERVEEIIAEKQDLIDFLVDGKIEKLQKIDVLMRLIA